MVALSARWVAEGPFLVDAGRRHRTLTDYPGFGVEVRYDCQGHPELARRLVEAGVRLGPYTVLGTNVRVSSIDPGLVETEFSEVRFHGNTERAKQTYRGLTPLTGDDIADIVAYVVNLPEHVDVLDVVVMPTAQRSASVVHRRETE